MDYKSVGRSAVDGAVLGSVVLSTVAVVADVTVGRTQILTAMMRGALLCAGANALIQVIATPKEENTRSWRAWQG